MIYTISENIATAVDSIVLIFFLVHCLSFKAIRHSLKILSTVLFSTVFFLATTFLNSVSILEGIYTILYFLILFAFCRITLQGKWWHQLLLVIVGLAAIFLVNSVISIISVSILKSDYSNLLLMRNPARVFLLFLSKLSLFVLLLTISNGVRKEKIILHLMQAIVSTVTLIITIIAGIIIEKIILEHLILVQYASIIMSCLAIIDILLLFILIQFSLQNQSNLKQIALQTRLHDDEVKMQEAIQWNKSIRTLQHDLNNHMSSIFQYIENGNSDKALEYIKKISGNLMKYPIYTNTNSQMLNAILDLKRMICKDEDIALKCYIQSDLTDFDDVAFSTIFGNLMDNAIEAEKEEKNKEIRLSVETLGTYLHITIQNRIHKPVIINGELPQTTKNDKLNHGLGMYSVSETIAHNNGVIEYYEKDNWFIVDVLMQQSSNVLL
jgi:signal transduction histidine kinase